MLGHKLAQVLQSKAEVAVAIRGSASRWPKALSGVRVFSSVDILNTGAMAELLDTWRPDVVLNAAGVVKQTMGEQDSLNTMAVNGVFPNMLGLLCELRDVRLIHYSTDCVFTGAPDGQRGPNGYRECDPADSRDLYGMSKLLGEPTGKTTLVLRTSIIGRELRAHVGLLEWFLAQGPGPIRGFTKALFTGLTTLELARVTSLVIHRFRDLTGIWHVSAPVVSKYDLLSQAATVFERPTIIEPYDDFYCDRRLDGSRFALKTGWQCPSWNELLTDIRLDAFDYSQRTMAGSPSAGSA